MAGVELGRNLAGWIEPPVIEYPHDISRIRRRYRIFDDQHTIKPTLYLLASTHVRMKPIRARIFGRELVDECRVGLHRRLGQMGHAVHCIGQPDAMPMNRGFLRQVIGEAHA